jgi:hypothetical protein
VTPADQQLQPVVEKVLGDQGVAGWRVRPGEFWCHVESPDEVRRGQGWKLHVSATPMSCPDVLERAAAVLVARGCSFKFAGTVDRVVELTAAHCDRARSGKFITAYPDDDDHLRLIAKELDEATWGLAGPGVLSDLPLRPGSLVHLRYGCFHAKAVLGDRGDYRPMLTAPDGTLVDDERNPWFEPPAWAEIPIDVPAGDAGVADDADGADGPVRIADRYVVHQAIRHANRGGVYLATDERTGHDVVLKEARPYTCGNRDGWYAPDLLRHEAEMLRLLAPLGAAPQPVQLFEYEGHLFLAEQLVPGDSLRGYVDDRVRDEVDTPDFHGDTVALARRLVDLVAAVHARGVVLQDLSPGNVMVTPERHVVLVDLECAQRVGLPWRRVYTPGYTAPERFAEFGADTGSDTGSAGSPDQTVDLYSLGAIVLHLATGVEPVLPADTAPGRPPADHIARYVATAGVDNATVRALAPLVLGLTGTDPTQRWSLDRARRFLASPDRVPDGTTGQAPWRATAERIITDGVGYILDTATPGAGRLWPPPAECAHTDPLAVQSGAAGVLSVLTRIASAHPDGRALDGVRMAADWIAGRLDDEPRLLPGLYFGRSGPAWALYDAGRLLDDPALMSRALEYSRRIPTDWAEQEICHGLAGAALTHLRLWRAGGDPDAARLARLCGDAIVRGLRRREVNLQWPASARPPHLASLSGYGFAHGVAGTGTVLLALARAFDVPEYLEIAWAGGVALCELAERRGGAAWWSAGRAPDDGPGFGYWCHGSSGVGTFLVRLWAATGEPWFLDLARQAAVAVARDRWRLGPETCHGLAGNGEFLLDLAAATGEAEHRDLAERLFAAIACRAALRDGRLLVPDGGYRDFPVAYNLGLGGVLTFAHRLLHGGPRPWLVDADVQPLAPLDPLREEVIDR